MKKMRFIADITFADNDNPAIAQRAHHLLMQGISGAISEVRDETGAIEHVAAKIETVVEETVTISKKEHAELIQDSKVLNALRAGGVEDWDWYQASLDDHLEEEK